MRLIFLLLLLSTAACAEESLIPQSVVSVYDGDTFTVNLSGCPTIFCQHISVRINGIDTPEIKGKCPSEIERAKQAKRFLEDKLRSAKLIELRNPVRDKYFRIRADVFIDGISVADEIQLKGLSRVYHGEHRSGWC